MGALHEALRSYSLYIGYQRYQVLLVSLTTVITVLIFISTVAIGIVLVRKLAEKKMMILLLISVNIS
jgi:hypothetical protein